MQIELHFWLAHPLNDYLRSYVITTSIYLFFGPICVVLTTHPRVQLYGGASSGGAAGMSGAGSSSSSGAASIRVTFDYFTLAFKDPATAQEAAAAMLFQRAQYAAMRQWLYQVGGTAVLLDALKSWYIYVCSNCSWL